MNLYSIQNNSFDVIRMITIIFYILILFGIVNSAPEMLDTFNYYIQIYVSLFLIYRFNPIRTIKVNDLDIKIAFSAGLFILLTTTIGHMIQSKIKIAEKYIKGEEHTILK